MANGGSRTRTLDPMHECNVGGPIERIAINIAGHLPDKDGGNQNLVVAMEYFTKYSEF